MSSDEDDAEFYYDEDGDYYNPSDDEENIAPPAAAPAAAAPAPRRAPAAPVPAPGPRRATRAQLQQQQGQNQPPQDPLAALFQQAQHLHPGAFQAGFGGHAFARPPASAFRRQYRAYSTAILEVQQGRSSGGTRSNLMYGGKIVMPASALHELTQLDIELPIDFEITNPAQTELTSHVGVLEFIADEGTVNLPQWVMDQLRLNEGDPIRIVGGRYPKGKLIKIQPQSSDFLEISDPKSVLENAMRNFSVISPGDIIEIGYRSLTFRLLIMETDPSDSAAISVIDTDLSVDFAPPLGYIEPDYSKLNAPPPSMKDKFVIDTNSTQDVDARGSGANTPVQQSGGGKSDVAPKNWEAFKGSGNSLAGKRIKGKGVSVRKIEAVDDDSKIIRTDKPRIITADTQIGSRQVPAALNLPFGNLFFGFDNLRPPPNSAEDIAEKEKLAAEQGATTAPFAGLSGNGNTLSGRARSQAGAPAGAPQTTTAAAATQRATSPRAPNVTQPFAGQGQSLSGNASKKKKKGVDAIVIDSD